VRRLKLWTDEGGSASLEFITVGVLLLVPLVYLVITLANLQAGALAVEGAARHAARVYVQSTTPADAAAAAERAVLFALADHGIDRDQASVQIGCSPKPAECLSRQGSVTVSVSVAVPLPLVPAAIDARLPLRVSVDAVATQQVSRFWSGQ
jgi:Flp pilus assembly protein TadG